MEATFVIVGGGIAGISCAEQISLQSPKDEKIVLVTATSMVKSVTNLSQISQLLSTFQVEEQEGQELEKHHENLKVIQDFVMEINAEKQLVHLKSGLEINYKYLVLCHGARPKLLSNDKYILGIRDTESVQKFQDNLSGAKRIMIVGNGGIATEMVHELSSIDIIWVIKDESITSTFVDPGAGQFFLDEMLKTNDERGKNNVVKRARFTAHEFQEQSKNACIGGALGPDWHSSISKQGSLFEGQKNVKIENETEVSKIEELADEEFKIQVTLTNGQSYKCDFLVSATGVIPNGKLIKIQGQGQGLDLDDNEAIIVNQQMQTNIKNIYAAGDVCSCQHWDHSPLWFQMRLWTQARQMGHFAGQCVVNAWLDQPPKELDFCFEMFSHVTRFFGFKVVLLGLFNGQGLNVADYEVLLRVTKGQEFVKVILKNGRMQGAVLIGETDLEETFENLILNQMDLSAYGEDLLDPNIDIEDYFD